MKYRVLKKEMTWERGDLVEMPKETAVPFVATGKVEEYYGPEPHQHVVVAVRPVSLSGRANNIFNG